MKNSIYRITCGMLFMFILFLTTAYAQVQSSKETQIKKDAEAVQKYFNWIDAQPRHSQPQPDATKVTKRSLGLKKTSGLEFVPNEKSIIMNGNAIKVDLHNYGGIAGGFPNAETRSISSLVWRGAPYIFQFCPIVGGSVVTTTGERIHIITDGLYDYTNYREVDPVTGKYWVWNPLPGYDDPTQSSIASNPAFDSDHDGKPDSWPREWYNTTLGEYVWPGYLTQGVNNADLECYWAMDDRENKEFKYYPYTNDTTRKGLGIQVDCRAFQWSNSLAANTLFMVYSITNKSDRDLDTVLFGIYGDPDIGGVDNDDDWGSFIPPYGTGVENIPVYARSMAYFWDKDGTGDRGVKLGYLGCKFLESPGNPNDGIDNDGDGMIDERQDDGIDNDHDWNAETDDVGVDGIPGTGDTGEGDGKPTAGLRLTDGSPDPLHPGEPNFEYTDLDEADQIGLTSFNNWTWGPTSKISDDEGVWNRCVPGNFSRIEEASDIVFVFGSGYISLKKGETKRISMAFLFGQDLPDLLTTASTVQDIYNKNYRFFKPPELPTLTAVPGDKKVTLFWDTKAEQSVDPITGKDFEGYVIYRSIDPSFSDILKITDGRGADFQYQPLKGLDGYDAKWDLVNGWKGFHPVTYQGRGTHYYLGDNVGLKHSFVDSNNVINGQTYYYAVVAYDHGDSLGIPPSETTKKISEDPITSKLNFDLNTARVVPGPRAAGYVPYVNPNSKFKHPQGYSNSKLNFRVINDLDVKDRNYTITFKDSVKLADTSYKAKNFTVACDAVISEQVLLFQEKNAKLSHTNIIVDGSLVVKDSAGNVYTNNVDYVIDALKGTIHRKSTGTMKDLAHFTVTYTYYPIYQSTAINSEDSNPVYDGIQLIVSNNSVVQPDTLASGWISGSGNGKVKAQMTPTAVLSSFKAKVAWPSDYRITFSDQMIDQAFFYRPPSSGYFSIPFKIEDVTTGVPVPIKCIVKKFQGSPDTTWSPRDTVVMLWPGAKTPVSAKDTLTWMFSLADSVSPAAGSVYSLIIARPFEKADVFTLETKAGKIDYDQAKDRMKDIFVVPNPYIAVNDLEPANRLSSQNRGERRIYFENLPQKCTIRIFTLAGELVRQLNHDQQMDNGREYWNLLNTDGFGVAYGVYLAHIDAPGVGTKLIKFALIK